MRGLNMYSKVTWFTIAVLMMGRVMASEASPSTVSEPLAEQTTSDVHFSLSPSKCVALNEGRTCFADVAFTLNLPDQREYCVREMGQATPIGCWRASETVKYLHSFAHSTTTTYELVDRARGDVISSQSIEVNWVHKIQTKKRRWRLF